MIVVPSIPQLNFQGLQWLKDESARWTAKVKTLSGQDRADAQFYLDAVNAELAQREAQYAGGWGSTIWGGITALFEAAGGSAGPGASGVATSVATTASDAATSVASTVKAGANRVLIVAAIVIVILGGFWLYLTKGK